MRRGYRKMSHLLCRGRAAKLVLQWRKSQRGERAMVWCAVTSCSAVLHFTGYRKQIHKDASCFYNASCYVMLLSTDKLISLLLYHVFLPECFQTSSLSHV